MTTEAIHERLAALRRPASATAMKHLCDANVWIALAVERHVHHADS
jgi:hypothetical protein